MKYIDRESGAIVSAKWVREKFSRTRMIPVEHRWTQWNFDAYGIDPILEEDAPDHDKQTHYAKKADLVKTDAGWISGWDIVPRYKDTDEKRAVMAKRISRLCDTAWNGATLVVDGVPYKTSEKGIALLQTATYYNQKTRNIISGGSVYERTPEQLRAAKIACDNFIQSCFDRAAALIEQVKVSDDPFSIDISTGWPAGDKE